MSLAEQLVRQIHDGGRKPTGLELELGEALERARGDIKFAAREIEASRRRVYRDIYDKVETLQIETSIDREMLDYTIGKDGPARAESYVMHGFVRRLAAAITDRHAMIERRIADEPNDYRGYRRVYRGKVYLLLPEHVAQLRERAHQ